jgi:hypothetical protein
LCSETAKALKPLFVGGGGMRGFGFGFAFGIDTVLREAPASRLC